MATDDKQRAAMGRVMVALAFSAGMAMVGLGCDDSPPDLDSYFLATPYGVPACDAVDGELRGQREVRLYRNGVVNVTGPSRGLQRYYQRHSLSFFATRAPQSTSLTYAIDSDTTRLTTQLRQRFPGVDLDDDESLMKDPVVYQRVLTYTVNFLFRPLVDFARQNGNLGTAVTNFIVLPQVSRPGGSALVPAGEGLAGLSISPALLAALAATGGPNATIWQGIDLRPDFTPMMFLDHAVLTTAAVRFPELRDLVVAHEFGHSAGLIHRDDGNNLMFPSVEPGVSQCTEALDPDQLATMKTTLFASSSAMALKITGPSPEPSRGKAFLPTPQTLRALLAGDARALHALLEPFLTTFPDP